MIVSERERKVVIAGGSGFLGVSLARHLSNAGFECVLVSRNPTKAIGPWRQVRWNGRDICDWHTELDGAVALVNLAGRTVDCIKTPDHQDEILRSRVEATRVLGLAVRNVRNPPPVWLQMSTAHIYGDPPEALCTEESAFGYGLAPFVARAWEEAFRESLLPSQRGVVLRTSFVIGRDQGAGGGALAKMKRLARLGLFGTIGSGKQGMSWIHELDLNRLFERGISDASMSGVYVASAPNPVSQREFAAELRKAVGMPIGLPATEWMVRLGAHWILRTDPELALYGRYVVSKRLAEEGFVFQFPQLVSAFDNLLGKE